MARRRQIGREQASQDVAQLSDEEGGRDESQTPRKEDDEHQEDAAPQRPPKRSRKRKSGDVNDNDDDGDEEERPYASLRPHVQYVSSRVIQNKWTALPEGVQEKVKELLRAIERPAISSATKWEIDRNADGAAVERKRMLAQQTISEMRRMLVKRLPELTFPPNTRELDFDHEAALLENRNLESQLATTTGSIDLLRAEIHREKALLAKETSRLNALKSNAKSAAVEKKRLAKKIHPKIKELDQNDDHVHQRTEMFQLSKDQTLLCDINEDDAELYPIVKQLRRHLESMRQNSLQVDGLKDAVSRTKAALDFQGGLQ
ncbi:hypothetical protein AAP_02025 [Ascosphaera apis ARSEF 7405]|uniref:Kinetochore protein fta7 n=1 Tax=Ascosphaera apis ARSEF 7405 TaxID=392613 RepID=A0A168AHG6_9EURO|nr:hypothetical protein AAP_02025 [Ascosphaera apis ARSEF 7405]